MIHRTLGSWTLRSAVLLDHRGTISEGFDCRQNFLHRYGAASFGPNRGLSSFEIYFDCQHTRCFCDGFFSLRRSRMSRHSFDLEHGPLHVRCETVAGPEEA